MKQGGEFSHASPRCLTSTAGAFFDSPRCFDMFLGFRSRRGSRVGHPLSIFFPYSLDASSRPCYISETDKNDEPQPEFLQC